MATLIQIKVTLPDMETQVFGPFDNFHEAQRCYLRWLGYREIEGKRVSWVETKKEKPRGES